jgi:hypothetical protein
LHFAQEDKGQDDERGKAYKKFLSAHYCGMKNKRKKVENVSDLVCANECTGMLQNIHPTDKELKKFHKMFNRKK